MERPVGDRERPLGAQAEKLIRRKLTSPGFPRWRSCTEQRASCRRRFPRTRAQERVASAHRRSRSKAILLRAAECQEIAATDSFCRPSCAGHRFASRAPMPAFPAAGPQRFGAQSISDPSAEDSSARLPNAGQHNRRKRGISCHELKARFVPKNRKSQPRTTQRRVARSTDQSCESEPSPRPRIRLRPGVR